ncbi:MAG TPA: diaminopimelate epimerase [Candidatus Baltobacteraceae bacterium]|nr:diaminopimelate epimerase [Candidatus Baltobacteraceae bacterium]
MSARVAVSKMHGARNDFIVLDARKQSVDDVHAFARRWCDRRAGVGADGLLVIGTSARAPVSMRVINADGSEAEMCGNGVRCVARYLDERGEGAQLEIDTMGGLIRTSVIERGEVYQVRVDVGEPQIVSRDATHPQSAVVVVGNPHLVLFRETIDAFDLRALGEEAAAEFPGGINVHLVEVDSPASLRARHYERGAGLTMACGTGAVASAVAAAARGDVRSPVLVRVPGGELSIEWNGSGHAFMTGPAVHVFDTQL